MLSFKQISTSSNAQSVSKYYEEMATAQDYYSSSSPVAAGREPRGYWGGSLRADFFLNGELKKGELQKILEGFHPVTSEKLASNAGENHKNGWDFTFSAPKSASVAFATADFETRIAIQFAQKKAVSAGIEFLEKQAFSNRDRGENASKTSKLLAACFEHCSSRDLDPQLHTHAIIANLSLRENSTVCAIDFDAKWKLAAGAVYRAALANELQKIGFKIERDSKKSFKIKGIPQQICDDFSKRRFAILEKSQEMGATTARGMQIATFATRSTKTETSRDELFKNWQNEAQKLGFTNIIQQAQQVSQNKAKMLSNNEIFNELHKQQSTFTPQQLHTAVAVAAAGFLNAKEIQERVESIVLDKEIVHLQAATARDRGERFDVRFTTQAQLNIEQKMLDNAISRKHERTHCVTFEENEKLTDEQNIALKHILSAAGAVQIVQGRAGAGKGFLLSEAHKKWQESGFEIIGAALASKAAKGLEESTQIESQTLHSLIYELETQQSTLTEKTIIVIDEAGMVGSRQLAKILDFAHKAHSKIVLVGDSLQLQPVDAGAGFRLLAEKIGFASLQNIQRQHDEKERKMVTQIANGESVSALELMRENGNLCIYKTHDDAAKQLVESWYKHKIENPAQTSIMLAGTRSDLNRLNSLARQKLIEDGGLRAESQNIALTRNGAQIERDFSVGEQILFCKNDKSLAVKNGDTGTLRKMEINENGNWHFEIEKDDGQTIQFSLTKDGYTELEHGYAISVHKSQGMTVGCAFVLASDTMQDKEWTYVAMSRARQKTQLYCSADYEKQLSAKMGVSRQKDTSLDYKQQLEL